MVRDNSVSRDLLLLFLDRKGIIAKLDSGR